MTQAQTLTRILDSLERVHATQADHGAQLAALAADARHLQAGVEREVKATDELKRIVYRRGGGLAAALSLVSVASLLISIYK